MRIISEQDYRVLTTHLPVILSAISGTQSNRIANAKRLLQCLNNKLTRNDNTISYETIRNLTKE